jgi:nucleotide-binding universal stress UspA family protein
MTLARKFDSHIILLRVVGRLNTASSSVSETLGIWRIQVGQHASQEAEAYLKAQRDNLIRSGFDVSTLLCHASPADGILNATTDYAVDLIAMSTHGHSRIARWAVGSVADKVVCHSYCPVLLVRQKLGGNLEMQLVRMVPETGD